MIMISSRHIFNLFFVIAFSFNFLSGCDSETKEDGKMKVVKIGVIAPFSGEDKEWGKNGMLGVETALAYHQDLRKKATIKIIKEDDRHNPVLAKAALKKLVEVDEVSVVLVLSGSQTMLAISEVADQYKTPIVATISSHPDITVSQWVTQLTFDDEVQGSVAALFVIDELLIENVGVVEDADDLHSVVLADQFIKRYYEAGGNVTTVDLSGKDENYDDLIKYLQESNLEFIYLPVKASKVIVFEQAARLVDYHPQVMVSDGLLSQMMLGYAKNLNLIDGMLATDIYSTEVPLTDFGQVVRSKFKELFEDPGTTISALSCEGAAAAFMAVELCGDNPEKSCINLMLRSGKEFEGILGPIQINLEGKAERPVFINKIKNKELQFMLKVY